MANERACLLLKNLAKRRILGPTIKKTPYRLLLIPAMVKSL